MSDCNHNSIAICRCEKCMDCGETIYRCNFCRSEDKENLLSLRTSIRIKKLKEKEEAESND